MEEKQRYSWQERIILSHIFTRMEEMVVPVGEIAGRGSLSGAKSHLPGGAVSATTTMYTIQCNPRFSAHTVFGHLLKKPYSRTHIFCHQKVALVKMVP